MATTINAAERMDRIYRRQRHVYNMTRKYFLLGRDRMLRGLKPAAGDRVLEIGCGTGRNLILAARMHPNARFFGIDISREMLVSAREAIARAGLAARIQVAHADARAFDPNRLFGEAEFERVFVSYTLSMIPGWRVALHSVCAQVAADGELHVVDFGRQRGLPAWFRTGLRQWLALFHVAPCDDLEPNLVILADRARATLWVEYPYRDYAQYAVLRMA